MQNASGSSSRSKSVTVAIVANRGYRTSGADGGHKTVQLSSLLKGSAGRFLLQTHKFGVHRRHHDMSGQGKYQSVWLPLLLAPKK